MATSPARFSPTSRDDDDGQDSLGKNDFEKFLKWLFIEYCPLRANFYIKEVRKNGKPDDRVIRTYSKRRMMMKMIFIK